MLTLYAQQNTMVHAPTVALMTAPVVTTVGGVCTLVEGVHWWSEYTGGVCGVCKLVECVNWWSV